MLSVNLNKVALLRNARDNSIPNIEEAAIMAIEAGCGGITLHPRVDRRHATIEDVKLISSLEIVRLKNIEINVEGDLRQELIEIVQKCNIHQFTIVPTRNGEKTTERGWNQQDNESLLKATIQELKGKVRLAMFIEPDEESVRYVHSLGVDAIEIFTQSYAEAYGTENFSHELNRVKQAAVIARSLNLRVNLGHDLNLQNLPDIIQAVHPDEVSIGHALIADTLSYGLGHMVTQYNKQIC